MILNLPEGEYVSDSVPRTDSPDAEAIRLQLQRVLASDEFRNAPILSRLLRYVVEHRVAGADTPLKEYTIGVDVFQRGAEFDPRVDTIVRVHARRLRERLARYYGTEGRDDPLLVSMPKGHYHARITARPARRQAAERDAIRIVLSASRDGPARGTFRSNTIPAPRTPLIGRAGEVAELLELLTDDDGLRLVTLTGAAGSGKTRLAIELGLRLQETLPDDVVFVKLASVADPQTLQLALLRAFGLRTLDNTPPIEHLCRHLHGLERAPPLVLDNFEQLAGAATVVGSLLDACMSLRVLVTSRIPLHLYGECEYPVGPLALPESDSMPPGELGSVPAVELFVQRAAAAHPGFTLTVDNAQAVARICRRFDGLPLGLELAAAQCRTLTPAQLLERVPERLDMPAGNVTDAPARQRTLRDAIEWSFALLTEQERTLYRRLSVFSGGFTLEAAEAVAGVRGYPGIDVASGVTGLLDNSLLQVASDVSEPRYAMLETIREFGLERLSGSGEDDEVRRAHAAYCLVLAEEGAARLVGKARRDWLARCDLEQDNFRNALDGLIQRGDGEWALRLVRGLYRYWEPRENLVVAYRSFLSVLDRFEPAAAPVLWSQIACCAGAMADRMGNQGVSLALNERGLAVARQSGDREVEIMALNTLAVCYAFMQRYKDAVATYKECLRLCRASGSERGVAAASSNLAVAWLALGEHGKARGLLQRALDSFRRQKEWTPAAWCLNQLGDAATVAGRYEDAEKHYRQSAGRFLQLGDFMGIARCWIDLGQLAVLRGKYGEAASLFVDALRIYSRQDFQRGVANLIEGCAALEVARGRGPQGLVLAGAAEAVRATRHMVAYPHQRARLDQALQPAREALLPDEIEGCHRRGIAMDAREAIEYARQCLADV